MTLGLCALALFGSSATARAGLPDNRAYEQVTPEEKPAGVAVSFLGWRAGATSDGNHFFIGSFDPLTDDGTQQIVSWYRFDREASGWKTHFLLPPSPNESVNAGNEEWALTHIGDDLGAIFDTQASLAPGDAAGNGNDVYTLDPNGSFLWLSDKSQMSGPFSNVATLQSTADRSHVLLQDTFSPLLPADYGRDTGPDDRVLYESENGLLRLVNVDSSGVRMTNGLVRLGDLDPVNTGAAGSSTINALSHDGSRIFFTPQEGSTPTGKAGLYMREATTTTVPIPPTPPGANADSVYAGATPDGSQVFFWTPDQLLPADTDSSVDLYRYDVATESLTRVTAASVPAEGDLQSPVFTSDDGSRVYFMASGDLAPGEGTSGTERTWIYAGGTISLVANARVLFTDGEGGTVCTPTQLTPDGSLLAFQTGKQLLPEDTDSSGDIYLYSATTRSLRLVSQGSAGGNGPETATLVPPNCNERVHHSLHQLSTTGRYVFFETGEALVPQDSNLQRDVYEYDTATDQTQLLSSGTELDGAEFLAADASGSNAFFVTAARLTPSDRDGFRDVYDARIGGVTTQPQEGNQVCLGEGCQGSPALPPPEGAPGSAGFMGRGNERSHRRHCVRAHHSHKRKRRGTPCGRPKRGKH